MLSFEQETLDDSLEVVSSSWQTLVGPAAATEPRLPASQVQPRLGQYSGHTCPWISVCVSDTGTDKHEVANTRGLGAEARVEATGPLCAITQRSFLFIAHLVIKLLSHFDPPNRLLQARDMDLFTAVVTLVNSASACVKTLRTEKWIFCTVGSLRSFSHGHQGCAGDRSRSEQEETHNWTRAALMKSFSSEKCRWTDRARREDNLPLLKVRSKCECARVRACLRVWWQWQCISLLLAALLCTRRGTFSVWAASGVTLICCLLKCFVDVAKWLLWNLLL